MVSSAPCTVVPKLATSTYQSSSKTFSTDVTKWRLAIKAATVVWERDGCLPTAQISLPLFRTRAARIRFRPIIVTALAFTLGVGPLTIAAGADRPLSAINPRHPPFALKRFGTRN